MWQWRMSSEHTFGGWCMSPKQQFCKLNHFKSLYQVIKDTESFSHSHTGTNHTWRIIPHPTHPHTHTVRIGVQSACNIHSFFHSDRPTGKTFPTHPNNIQSHWNWPHLEDLTPTPTPQMVWIRVLSVCCCNINSFFYAVTHQRVKTFPTHPNTVTSTQHSGTFSY